MTTTKSNAKIDDDVIKRLTHYYETTFVMVMTLAEAGKLSANEIVLWVEQMKAFWRLMIDLGVPHDTLIGLRGGEWLFDPNVADKIIGGQIRLGCINQGVFEALK